MNDIDLFGGDPSPALATLAAEINAEHDAAEGHARKAIEHARAAGEKLLLAKAGVAHGQWLPWLNGEIESGRLEVKRSQANTYMRVASNYQRAGNLPDGATSIRAALELISDQEPEEQQGTLIDVEAERQARKEAEAKAEAERRRNQEWAEQSNGQRKQIRALEEQVDLLNTRDRMMQEQILSTHGSLKFL